MFDCFLNTPLDRTNSSQVLQRITQTLKLRKNYLHHRCSPVNYGYFIRIIFFWNTYELVILMRAAILGCSISLDQIQSVRLNHGFSVGSRAPTRFNIKILHSSTIFQNDQIQQSNYHDISKEIMQLYHQHAKIQSI